MADNPGNKLAPKTLDKNVLARLAAGVDYDREMQRLKNLTDYPYAPGPMEEDTDFRPHIADLMAKMGLPMPAPAGSNNYYTQQQYEQAVRQAYPVDPIRQMLEQQARMRQAQAMRPIAGSAPILSPRGFIPDMPQTNYLRDLMFGR